MGRPRRLLLIGQALNRPSGERMMRLPVELRLPYARRLALTGAVGRRLATLGGLTVLQYLRRTERRNLLDRWPGYQFPAREAREAALRMQPELDGRRVIFMGKQVAQAFWCGRYELLQWWPGRRVTAGGEERTWEFAIVPHPSRLNRWWNEPRHGRKAADFLREAFEEAGRE